MRWRGMPCPSCNPSDEDYPATAATRLQMMTMYASLKAVVRKFDSGLSRGQRAGLSPPFKGRAAPNTKIRRLSTRRRVENGDGSLILVADATAAQRCLRASDHAAL